MYSHNIGGAGMKPIIILEDNERARLEELSSRFESVARRRRKMDPETKKTMLERASFDLAIFGRHMISKYGSDAFPTVMQIAEFLRDAKNGAPKYIDIALCPLPPEKRVPFIPAEYIKRDCAHSAREVSNLALSSFE